MKPFLLWLILAQGGDIATTIAATKNGCVEANQIAAPRLNKAFSAKIALTVGIAISVPFTYKNHPKTSKFSMILPAAVGSFAIVWNTSQIIRGCR